VTPERLDLTGDGARELVADYNIMRTEIESRLTGRHVVRRKIESVSIEPDLALLDINRKHARFSDEGKNKRRIRIIVNLVRRADLLDLAFAHDHHAVGELERLLLIVRDEYRGVSGLVVKLAEPTAKVTAHLGVERAERLIEEKQARLDGKRPGKSHPVTLTSRQLRRVTLLEAGELNEVEQLKRAALDLLPARPPLVWPHTQAEADILEHRHVAEQSVVLEHQADIALLHRDPQRVLPVEQHPTGGRHVESG